MLLEELFVQLRNGLANNMWKDCDRDTNQAFFVWQPHRCLVYSYQVSFSSLLDYDTFMSFLQKEVLCSLIQNSFGVALKRLSVTAEASAYSSTAPNVTSFRTRTSDQTMALCVAAFN
jgi:hypothetical protein